MVFSTSLSKPEAPLANKQSEGEKMSVVAHGRPSLHRNPMLVHATPRLRYSGRTVVNSSVFGAAGPVVAASTARSRRTSAISKTSETSGYVRGASGVPLTRPAAGEALYSPKSGGEGAASGTSGVNPSYARTRTRTRARTHTYARLRNIRIPLTSLTRVRGHRRTYQTAEVKA